MEIPAHCDSERGLVHCTQHLWLTIYEMEMITAASAIDCERVYSWMGNFTIFNLNGCEARDTAWNCLSHYDIVAFHQESCFHQSCFQDSQMLCGVIKTDCNDAKMRLACSFSAGREITCFADLIGLWFNDELLTWSYAEGVLFGIGLV